MPLATHFEFTSLVFPANEGEEETINPGCYGERLALFIAEGFRARSHTLRSPFAEDWGWVVPISDMGYSTWIGCGSVAGEPNRFLCFIEPDAPRWWHFIQRERVKVGIELLSHQLAEILKHPDVSGLQMYTKSNYMSGL